MNFPEHLKAGFAGSIAVTCCAVGFTQEPLELLAVFGVTLAGSLAPDLDTQSTPSMAAAAIAFAIGIGGFVFREPYVPLAITTFFCFIKIFSHRTWVHTYTVVAIILFLGIEYNEPITVPFCIGYIIHFVVDKIWPWRVSNWIKPILPKMVK